jgi:hypothetical protein
VRVRRLISVVVVFGLLQSPYRSSAETVPLPDVLSQVRVSGYDPAQVFGLSRFDPEFDRILWEAAQCVLPGCVISASKEVTGYVRAALSEAPETSRNKLGEAYAAQSLLFAWEFGHTPVTAQNAYLLAVASAKLLDVDHGTRTDSAPSTAKVSLGVVFVLVLATLATGAVLLIRRPRAPQMSSLDRDLINLGAELDALWIKQGTAMAEAVKTKPYRFHLRNIRRRWAGEGPKDLDAFRLQVNDLRVMTPEELVFFRNYFVRATEDASVRIDFEEFFEQVGGILHRNGPRLRAGLTGLGAGLLLVSSLTPGGPADVERTTRLKSWLDQTVILKAEDAKVFADTYGKSVGFSPVYSVSAR